MTKADTKKFSELMLAMEKYFGKDLEPRIRRLYFEGLQDMSIEQFEAATAKALSTLKYLPKIAELREMIDGSPDDQATIAWEMLLTAIERVGFYSSLWIESPAITQAVRSTFGSWTQCCTDFHPVYNLDGDQVGGLTQEMVAARRKEFVNHFRNALRSPRQIERYFPGNHEQVNSETIGTWKRGEISSIGIGVIANGQVGDISLPADPYTARLSLEGRRMLEAGEAPKMLEAAHLEKRKRLEANEKTARLLLAECSGAPERISLQDAAREGVISVEEGLAILRGALPLRRMEAEGE